MTQHTILGDPPLTVHLRRSRRARRISLRVSRLDGKITLTMPESVSKHEAIAFAEEKADWLRQHYSHIPVSIDVKLGIELPIFGRMREIVSVQGRKVELAEDYIGVPGSSKLVAARLQGYLKELARTRLSEAVEHYHGVLDRPFARLTLRDTRSRWGSCSSAGVLMFSWRLVMAPSDVLDYVAAHEVAHLAEMNHSQAFWNTVTLIHGPFDNPKSWLRNHGQELHRYRFTQSKV
ncbi:M48 family metallopeptidase [Pseudopelagicola sp. nBUS_19]|uniref:M48 family metallopeptidase n=2 Tax=unclassified Pseudopelagicola TaxID=2649563 RepID=UPI003EC0E93F